jgi:hypothetical protein
MADELTADAHPDKTFFVESITKDITLLDCVLDLIDNSIDSASSTLQEGDVLTKPDSLKNFRIDIKFNKDEFSITDNANGISLEDAKTSVFRFGNIKRENKESIGYYGIGLKRATFKLGKDILVWSTTRTETFGVAINIDDWLSRPNDWSFPIELENETGAYDKTGVEITIKALYPEISQTLAAPIFKTKLIETIGRDYYFFLKAGIEVYINDEPVTAAELEIKSSDQFSIGTDDYDDDGVHVKLITGCHSQFDNSDSDDPDNFDPKVSGWYVICNNRIILAANKDDKTIWKGKHEGFSYWHPQYNGFVGFVFFNSHEQSKLPWTTTKRYVDLESIVYRTAITKMIDMTKPWLKYTNDRKKNIDEARNIEIAAPATSLAKLAVEPMQQKKAATFPTIQQQDIVNLATITYKVEKYKAEKCKLTLLNPGMSNGELGRRTFDYYYENEID